MNESTNVPDPLRPEDCGLRPEQRFKFRHVNEITGTVVLGIIAVLIAAVVWTGYSQRWFRSRVTLRIVLPEAGAAGVRQGSEVYFLGTMVGTVSDVLVDAAGRMEARANIRRDFFRFVRADSSAVVKKKFGVAGDAYFEITRGEGQPLAEKNAFIVCRDLPVSVEAAIEELRSAALPVFEKLSTGLDTWTALGTNLIQTQHRLEQLLVRLDHIVAAVERGEGTAGKLITDPALAEQAAELLTRANETMAELRRVMTNLNAAVRNVQDGTARLPEITDALANEAKDLPGLVLQTQIAVRELERLIEAVQRHWLVRKYVNKTNPPPLRPWPELQKPQKEPVKSLRSPKDSAK
jgi:phospholipid/cholesterol/gamma-HCH transport system substrate-binding protein